MDKLLMEDFQAGEMGKRDHIGWLKCNGVHVMVQIGYQASEEEAVKILEAFSKAV